MPDDLSSPVPVLSGLREIADRYDGYIVDLWGVMHDGVRPYPGACETLRTLRALGKRVVMLSNAPRCAAAAIERSARVGVTPDLYDHLMCSGEETWRALKERSDPWYKALGRRVLLFAAEYDRPFLAGLDLEEATGPADADFLLVTGAASGETVADYEARLVAAVSAGLPMVCANPDLDVIKGTTRLLCAGAVAARYAALGGDVRQHGKPDPAIYDMAVELLGVKDRGRILALGDSFHTDVAGARGAGIDVAFIPGGIHADELGFRPGVEPSAAMVAPLIKRFNVTPTYIVPTLRW